MKNIKRIVSVCLSLMMVFTMMIGFAHADSTGEVITIGANLNQQQKKEILNYFGVDENNPEIMYVNNQQERKYLSGVAPDSQLGHVTMSSSYVVPTASGGINVKTSNITWVTSSMIASTLSTAGVDNANVVAAAPFPVSGTGALTGIIMAFEKSSGEQLTEEKKQLANKELVATGTLAEEVGKDKASGIINDSKKEVIKDGLKDEKDIEKAVKDVANNYNVTLNAGDINVIVNLLKDIGNQNYNYKDMKDTLDNISANVGYNLKEAGEKVDIDGVFNKAKSFINNNKDAKEFFNQFDDSKLSKDAVVSTTASGIESAQKAAEDVGQKVNDSGLWDKIKSFFQSLFN
ncbi:MAG: DUF1002 domain-containing protein [Peptostreptococcus sp.]|uniref:DUF1002 domain-containing protein n=1 Tax=Peptostreptococcus sp. TaxID=1262 RepID=UPI002FC5BA4B